MRDGGGPLAEASSAGIAGVPHGGFGRGQWAELGECWRNGPVQPSSGRPACQRLRQGVYSDRALERLLARDVPSADVIRIFFSHVSPLPFLFLISIFLSYLSSFFLFLFFLNSSKTLYI